MEFRTCGAAVKCALIALCDYNRSLYDVPHKGLYHNRHDLDGLGH